MPTRRSTRTRTTAARPSRRRSARTRSQSEDDSVEDVVEETAERDEEEESPRSRLEAVAEEGEDAEAGAAHTFRILLSTDNHLGYKEKDPVRGHDSFVAFEEMLQTARAENVDFIVLGGDLFHDNKPSRGTVYRTLSLLRKYCFGDKDIEFTIASDMDKNFRGHAGEPGVANFMDPNFNVSIPVFSIHGNHDDTTRDGGDDMLSAVDILSAANMVNFFGTVETIEQIPLHPILMVKGDTKLALYGLGNVRDERLSRMIEQDALKWKRDSNSVEDCFNMFVLHQNRPDKGRGASNCVKEEHLPDWLDLVMWGHEHECMISPFRSASDTYYITQPGSSVATSLIEGEAVQKKMALLQVRDKNFKFKPIPFRTVRPFLMHSISLEDYEQLSDMDPEDKQTDEAVAEILRQRVNAMVAEVHANYDTKNGYPPTMKGRDKRGRILPLILVKVDRGKFRTLNVQRFGASFLNIVANPNNLVRFHKRRAAPAQRRVTNPVEFDADDIPMDLGSGDKISASHLQKLTIRKLEQHDAQLQLLQDTVFNSAVESYVLKQETRAIEEFVKQTLVAAEKECMERIEGENLKRKDIEEVVQAFGEDMNSKEKAKQEAKRRKSTGSTSRKHRGGSAGRDDEDGESSQSNVDDSGDEQIFRATMAEAPSTKQRAASKARKKAPSEDSDIEDESSSEESSMRSSGLKSKAAKTRATRKRRAPAKAKASAKRPAKKAAKGQGTLDSLLTSSSSKKRARTTRSRKESSEEEESDSDDEVQESLLSGYSQQSKTGAGRRGRTRKARR